MTDTPRVPFSLSANHVGVTVSDLGRSIAFYRDLLGFHVAYERGEVAAEYMPRLVGIPGARLKIAGLDIPGSSDPTPTALVLLVAALAAVIIVTLREQQRRPVVA